MGFSLLLLADLQSVAVIPARSRQASRGRQVPSPGIQTEAKQQPRVLPFLFCWDKREMLCEGTFRRSLQLASHHITKQGY